ncbi:MAG: taurine dioxygenase [Phenylobacterium sp.]|nr:taurine dioxygenase [Phenylobacterium sp.]
MTSDRRGSKGPMIRHAADPGRPFEHFRASRLTPLIGAEISGLDLRKPLAAPVVEELRLALADHLVLFFRDQAISPEQHVAFGRNFGELHRHPAAPHVEGRPEVMIIAADETSERANGEGWHTDVSCDPEPPMGSILHIKACPPEGGDTLFANMYAAYDALSDRMKAHLDGLEAVHDGEHVYRGLYANLGVADKPSYPRARHPVVRTHPWTGRKCLYVNQGFTTHLVGLPREESAALLGYLFRHMAHPLFQCRFRWTPDAIAFWDNRSAQHHAIWDYWPHRRFGRRVTIKGERPVGG